MSFIHLPLVVARKPRTSEREWDQATSWFGDRPRLGSLSWPRDAKTGEPLIFVAQIDLREIVRHAPEFPAHGSLAFFLGARGSLDGAVLHVPGDTSGRRTDPPSDARPVRVLGGYPFPHDDCPGVAALFPYWPLELKPLNIPVPDLDDEDAVMAAIERESTAAVNNIFPDGRSHLSFKEASAACEGMPLPHWWHSAIFLAGCMRNAMHNAPNRLRAIEPYLAKARADVQALTAKSKPVLGIFGRRAAPPGPELEKARQTLDRYERQVAAYQAELPKFTALVEECVALAAGRKPTDPMEPADWRTLSALFERARGEFKDIGRYGVPFSLQDIEGETLLYLLTADEAAYLSLPAPIRALANRRCRLPSGGAWHQMFGRGVDIQGGAIENSIDHHMLLQLVYDDMMHWRFGDVGAYQFWIRPEDVKARNWPAAQLTFECH
jgi:hypothetical protein